MEYAVDIKSVTKKYKLYKNKKEQLLDLVLPTKRGKDFYALKNVNFQAKKGETIGIVGVNGSGKSTLLNIIAGIIPETTGEIHVKGDISYLSVGAGLKQDISGRENIKMICLMLGFSEKEIIEMEPDIIDFSELGEFIDTPVKKYSSGMKSRLGFAISVSANPDILIIDEAISVGDKTFSKKCLDKVNEFKNDGKTILFVSHSNAQVKQFCDKVLWLEYGTVRDYGEANKIIAEYDEFFKFYNKLSKEDKEKYRNERKFATI